MNGSVLDLVLFDSWIPWISDTTHIAESLVTIFELKNTRVLKFFISFLYYTGTCWNVFSKI
jgi:hypothetical protein